jgi:cell division protein YceG involved in septum cleavage
MAAMNKRIVITGMICIILLLSACSGAVSVPTATSESTMTPAPTSSPTVQPTLIPTTPPEETAVPIKGTVRVRGGDTLERDIIPQLCEIFSLSEEMVKDELAKAQSRLIGDELTDFRRMEGIIVPGSYEVKNESLSDYVNIWIYDAELRYDRLLAMCGDTNDLEVWEQLTLASIVDWECIGDEFQAETAAVFLNRIHDDAKLQSCVTVEYALGYQRPFLTLDDIDVDSAYNTFKTRGLPPGPICAVDEKSLFASIQKAVDSSLYFFFYDYSLGTMKFFSDYGAFKEDANISKQMFADTFDMGKYDKIDKRSVFGQ